MTRKAFVLAATDYGPMIINRLDHATQGGATYGVGHDLLETGAFSRDVGDMASGLLELRRRYYGDGVVAVDCGANIGVFTIAWARQMTGWGSVVGIEAQERLFYALAGNIALNNLTNAWAVLAAVGDTAGSMAVPVPDYEAAASFGSIGLREAADCGQTISYRREDLVRINAISIDGMAMERIDLLKIDVEGMELDVLLGATETLATKMPVVIVEWIKTDPLKLTQALERAGYEHWVAGMNVVAVHRDDPVARHLSSVKAQAG